MTKPGAVRMAANVKRLARVAAEVEHHEEAQAREVVRAHAAARIREMMLALVANTPRAGAGLVVAPQAKVDDGLLEVRVYAEMSQPDLAAHFLAVKAGNAGVDPRIRSSRGRKLVIRSTLPLPVLVDTKVVGSTPARFRIRSGGPLVIVGDGDGVSHPAAQSLVTAVKTHALPPEDVAQASEAGNAAVTPHPAALELARRTRPLALAVATGAAVGLMPTLSRWLNRHRH